jgi:hypothetical protein
MENPFEPIKFSENSGGEETLVLSQDRQNLVRIAKYQRMILILILLNFFAIPLLVAVPTEWWLLVLLWTIVQCVAAYVLNLKLAIQLYGSRVGLFLGIACLIPFVGLVVWSLLNAKATKLLESNGVKVGLLGANPSFV